MEFKGLVGESERVRSRKLNQGTTTASTSFPSPRHLSPSPLLLENSLSTSILNWNPKVSQKRISGSRSKCNPEKTQDNVQEAFGRPNHTLLRKPNNRIGKQKESRKGIKDVKEGEQNPSPETPSKVKQSRQNLMA